MLLGLLRRVGELFQIIYPETCVVCGKNLSYSEHILCTDCLLKMPGTHMHSADDNQTTRLLAGHVPFRHATSLFDYQKHTGYARLIYKLKYDGRDDIGVLLGELLGVELLRSGFMDGVDAIVPIPLHKKRQRWRGYNQSEMIACGIANITGTPVLTSAVVRTVNTQTQTRKSKQERLENVQGIFAVANPADLQGKHIAIIDDVITTGATCLSCAETILAKSQVKAISIASVGIA